MITHQLSNSGVQESFNILGKLQSLKKIELTLSGNYAQLPHILSYLCSQLQQLPNLQELVVVVPNANTIEAKVDLAIKELVTWAQHQKIKLYLELLCVQGLNFGNLKQFQQLLESLKCTFIIQPSVAQQFKKYFDLSLKVVN